MPISVKSRNASCLTACFFMASAAASVAPAHAADSIMEERFAADAPLVQSAVPGFGFELGAGVSTQPSFEGSDRYTFTGFPIFHFGYLRLENGFSIGGGDGTGFGIAPSFRYLGARNVKDDPALRGLYDIDAAIELGAGLLLHLGQCANFRRRALRRNRPSCICWRSGRRCNHAAA